MDNPTAHHLICSAPTPVLSKFAPSLTFIATVTNVRYDPVSMLILLNSNILYSRTFPYGSIQRPQVAKHK